MALKRNLFMVLSIGGLGAILVLGLVQLFELRFRSGDIFPRYSSFRSDPQGVKIFFQSLKEYPDIVAERLVKPLEEDNTEGKTLLFLGYDASSVGRNIDTVLDPFLTSGGHAVVAFKPAKAIRRRPKKDDSETEIGKDKDADVEEESKPKNHDPETCGSCQNRMVKERWQVELEWFSRKELKDLDPENRAIPVSENQRLEPIYWNSALWFDTLGEEWNVLYEYLGKPVVIERTWGAGSVILMADSYLFSNEAMVQHRQTAMLVKMLGPQKTILFDELHHGITSKEGIMMLVNRYGLTGVLISLLVVVGLFIWQRSSSFVPKYSDPNDGKNKVNLTVDSNQGFTNLLIRHIPQKQLMKTMMDEWKSTFARTATMKKKSETLNAEFLHLEKQNKKTSPTEVYNQLLKRVNERK